MLFDAALPIRLLVDRRDSDVTRACLGLFPSLIATQTATRIERFVIVSPEDDLCEIEERLQPFANKLRFVFKSDETLFAELGLSKDWISITPGWFKQQIIKLQLVAQSTSSAVLVLDADIVSLAELPSLNTLSYPYSRVSAASFPGWYRMSAAALSIEHDDLLTSNIGECMGVTPEFLIPFITRELIDRLLTVGSGKPWPEYLMSFTKSFTETWTEYSLYWLWCIFKGYAKTHYRGQQIYRFVEDVTGLQATLALVTPNAIEQPNLPPFIVLQSTKLSLQDCAPIYEHIGALLATKQRVLGR